MPTSIRLARLEIWTDLECNGGTRLAFFAPLPSSAIRSREVNGEHTLKVTVNRDADAWPYIATERVLRCVLTDGTYHEWRITKPTETHEKDGRKNADIDAQDTLYDLSHRIVVRTEVNGDAYTDFDLYGLSASDHLAIILSSSPSYFTAGTVDFGAGVKVDLAYRAFTPLEALRKLAEALPGGAELEVTRNGTSGYLVGIRTKVGASAAKTYFRYQKNLDGVRRKLDATGQPSRVLPLGQDVESRRFDMGEASWEVSVIAGTTLTLLGSPLAFEDQLNGLYLRRAVGSTPTLISDSMLATQQVVVASAAGIVVGDRVQIRRNSAGDELLYLDRPGATRIRTEVLERPDIPPVDNLVKNPFLSTWSAGLPVNWAKVGLPTVTQVTDPVNHRWGAASAQLVCLATEQGLETDWIPVNPTAASPFFGAQISLYVAEGVWRFEIIAEDAGSAHTYVIPDDTVVGGRAYTSVVGQWVDRLSIQDQATNFKELAIVRAKVRVIADRLDSVSGQASCYLDAAQLVRTSLPDLPFFDGYASCALWAAANAELVKWTSPPTELTVDLIDLYRVDPTLFPHDGLVLGGIVRVDDTALGLSYDSRIVKLVEELVQEGATQVELSQKPEDLANTQTENQDQLGERRNGVLVPRGATGDVDGEPRLDEDYDKLYLFPAKFPAAQSVRYISSATPIVEADVLASGSTSNADQILVHTFTADREQRWVGVAYYPALGATGKVGRIHILPPWTFFTRDNRPVLEWQTYPTARPSVVRIGLTLVDDGDQVALYYRSWTDGGSPPAFTRSPGSGFVSDPYEVSVDVTRPAADGNPDVIFEAYGVDDQGNESLLTRLRVRKSMVLQETPRVFPELDEDGDKLYLVWQPNIGAARIQWLTDLIDEPALVEVQASTNFDTTGKVLVATFDPNGAQTQQAFIGFIPQSAADGGGTRDPGGLVVLPYTYRRGNDRPRVSAVELDPGDPGVERLLLTAIDDGDNVALYYRTYVKGASPPAYTRYPSSGYLADPISQIVSWTKPAEGAANQVIEAYAEDDTSPTPLQSVDLYLESDGDDVPSGSFEHAIDPDTGVVRIIPTAADSDAKSWRFRVKKTTVSDDTYNVPSFNDSASDEFKGTAFGTPVVLSGFALVKGERLNVYGWFFRTATATAAAQGSSTTSNPVTAVEHGDDQDAAFTDIAIGFDDAGKVLTSWIGNAKFAKGYVNVGLGSAPGTPTAGSKDGTLTGGSGTGKWDGSGGLASKVAAMGQKVFIRGVGENANGVVSTRVFSSERRRGDAQYIPPEFFVTATRGATNIDITLAGTDPSQAVTALDYRERVPGATSFGSWTTWSGGTGSPPATVYSKTYSRAADGGLDGAFEWRATYTDALGASQTKGDTIQYSALRQISRDMVFHPAQGAPATSGQSWDFGTTSPTSAGLALNPNAAATGLYWKTPIVLPVGIHLTSIDQELLCVHPGGGGDTALGYFQKASNEISSSNLATIARTSGSGFGSDGPGSLSYTVAAGDVFWMVNELFGAASKIDVGAGRIRVYYDAPTLEQRY